ncbi:MAG: cytidine deaminase [Mycoplasma sp.]|nr:cytidine deaminase [Mycoplasma sp.]
MKKIEEITKELLVLSEKAYAPFSNFAVAAILITNDGKKIEGVNVENSVFPLTICGERNAIFSAISQGYRPGDFKEIHLMTNYGKVLGSPCGSCRQVLSELLGLDKKVFMHGEGVVKEYKVSELLPLAFGDKDLPK